VSVTRMIHLSCDECLESQESSYWSVADARESARLDGWASRKSPDLCPPCATRADSRSRLTQDAREALADAGLTERGWAQRHHGTDRWHGDTCGCPDDRCRGHHHKEADECGCIRSLLNEGEHYR
jgi:hypothetical protein